MTYGPINWINLTLGILLVIIPLFFYLKDFDPKRIAPENMGATDQTMNTIEQLGVGGSLILMYVPYGVGEYGFPSVFAMMLCWGLGAVIVIAANITYFVYRRKDTKTMAIVSAAIPPMLFILTGFCLHQYLLIVTGVLYLGGHIYMTLLRRKARLSKETEDEQKPAETK